MLNSYAIAFLSEGMHNENTIIQDKEVSWNYVKYFVLISHKVDLT
jgi:hypothetical protein